MPSLKDLGLPPLHDPDREGYDSEGRYIGLVDWAARKSDWETDIFEKPEAADDTEYKMPLHRIHI